jgi:hypothetical protein
MGEMLPGKDPVRFLMAQILRELDQTPTIIVVLELQMSSSEQSQPEQQKFIRFTSVAPPQALPNRFIFSTAPARCFFDALQGLFGGHSLQ